MTPDELTNLLAQNEYLVLDISPEDFQELEKFLKKRGYTYRPGTRKLTIKTQTPIHSAVADWAARLVEAVAVTGAVKRDDLILLSKERMSGFADGYEDVIKVSDMGVLPGDQFRPSIIFEVGYAERYEDLKEDVKILLEGSQGEVTTVIVIKIEPVTGGETEIQEGFVEVWHLVNGKAERGGERKDLFPPPRNHHTQRLFLTLGEILGGEFGNLVTEDWAEDDTIYILLNHLRSAINKEVKRHQIPATVEPEPDA